MRIIRKIPIRERKNMKKTFFKNMKLNTKIQFTVFTGILIALLLAVITLSVVIKYYSQKLYTQFNNTSNILSNRLSNELSEIESLSLTMAGTSAIQNYLQKINSNNSLYELSLAETDMIKSMSNTFYSFDSISSITIIDSAHKRITVGTSPGSDLRVHRPEIEDLAYKNTGSQLWYYSPESKGHIYSVRAIRNVKNLELNSLGVLVIDFNLPKMLEQISTLSGEENVNSLLASKTNTVINSTLPFQLNLDSADSLTKISEQGKQKIGGYYYYLYKKDLPLENMYIVIFFPLNSLIRQGHIIFFSLVTLFSFILAVEIFTVRVIAKSITRPIDILIRHMSEVEQNDLSTKFLEQTDYYVRKEEIGYLYRNFHKMMKRIRLLIKENYEKQLVLTENRYRTLQAQINPHFLYNTLDSINWMAKAHEEREISTMIESLALLLRNTITTEAHLIPLSTELEILNGYILLQRYRFEERLQFTLSVDDVLKDCLVPSLILQVLAENSIKHGLEENTGQCSIRVTLVPLNEHHYKMEIEDNAGGFDPEIAGQLVEGTYHSRNKGIGLRNIIDRLNIDFENRYTFHIDNVPGTGTTIRFLLPYRRE